MTAFTRSGHSGSPNCSRYIVSKRLWTLLSILNINQIAGPGFKGFKYCSMRMVFSVGQVKTVSWQCKIYCPYQVSFFQFLSNQKVTDDQYPDTI